MRRIKELRIFEPESEGRTELKLSRAPAQANFSSVLLSDSGLEFKRDLELRDEMIDFLFELGLFAAKTGLVVVALIIIMVAMVYFGSRGRSPKRYLDIEKINDRLLNNQRALQSQILGKKEFKSLLKTDKKRLAERKKLGLSEAAKLHPASGTNPVSDLSGSAPSQPDAAVDGKTVFVIDFEGDLRAEGVESLREEVTTILGVATPTDEVVVRLESPGGIVIGYGLGAAQLRRIRDKGIPLTICVDKVAASGGYMMACVGTRILAAPFAIIGSVGVVAAFANFHRILDKHNVDYHEVTAGEFKRTVSIFGEITPQGYEKFKAQIQDTHGLFKSFVQSNRPQLKVDEISTGEYWYGMQALQLNLVDELITSDDYLLKAHDEHAEILHIKLHTRQNLMERLSHSFVSTWTIYLQKWAKDAFLARFGL